MQKHAAYYARTSSKQNVDKGDGKFKDSLERQLLEINMYSDQNSLVITHGEYDAGVSGNTALEKRDGMLRLVEHCRENEIDTILVEDASRFARDKDHAIRGIYYLLSMGIKSLVCCDKKMDIIDMWNSDPMTAIIPFIEFAAADKYRRDIAARLGAARSRYKAKYGKCGGPPKTIEINMDLYKEVKRLRRVNPATGKRRSYRNISMELAGNGYLDRFGRPMAAQTIKQISLQKPQSLVGGQNE
jgi:DNA invertase Pin-like site-specific DNA recombinase